MKSLPLLLVIAILVTSVNAVLAEEFLLRFEVVGFEDAPATRSDLKALATGFGVEELFAKDPRDKVLRSIEVVARPNSPFHAKAVIGPRSLEFGGCLKPEADGRVILAYRFADRFDTGVDAPLDDKGNTLRLYDSSTSCGSQQILKLDASLDSGGYVRRATQVLADGTTKTTITKIRYVVTFTKHRPVDEAPRELDRQ